MSIDERIAAELRRHAPPVDEDKAWERIRSAAPARRRARAFRLLAASAGALGFLFLGFTLANLNPGSAPASDPRSPFLDTWVTTDPDGSTPTMVIQASGGEDVEIVVHDDFASVCSGAPSTTTGTGRLEGSAKLVIPSPVPTCGDGSQPVALSGPPLEEQLRDLTFVYDLESDALTDNFGVVWHRVGSEVPDPEPTTILWPQSSLEEVREAQRLADAGDPDFTWQLEPALEENLDTADYLGDPEIFARFLKEELGWEEFSRLLGAEYGDGTIGVTYIRCAPGESNPNYPDDPRVGGCGPTIDEFRYETVTVTVAQPGQHGPSGIWVAVSSEIVEPIAQVIPPTDAEATAILGAFLQARIDGQGAEQYFGGGDGTAQLLYATSTGASYERSEFVRVDAPNWPSGSVRFEVRLFAENDQTVVEQFFSLERDRNGRWGLKAGSETLENGQALPPLYEFLDGEVTFVAAPPWDHSFAGWEFSPTMTTLHLNRQSQERFVLLADPRPIVTGCVHAPAPVDAEALAESLRSDPDLEATELVPVTVAGIAALRMDVLAATSGNLCDEVGIPEVVAGGTATGLEPGQRMRLYLMDYPGGSARVLAIAIIAPAPRFESVLESATPIVDSIEFHTG